MTSRDFCYWLQGLFELEPKKKTLDAKQLALVRAHLALVFQHEIDPSFGTPEERARLQATHDGSIEKLTERIDALEARPARVVVENRGPQKIMC